MNLHVTCCCQKLFEVKLLHHYWLDDGATVFDLIADPQLKAKRLQEYDMRKLMSILPTATTVDKLNSIGGMFKVTAHGFMVFVPKNTKLDPASQWEWAVMIKDSRMLAYTTQGMLPRKILEFRHPVQHSIYRYKENVQVFGNADGDSRGSQLFLSQPLPKLEADDRIEALFLSGNSLKQLTSDQPAAQSQTLNAAYRKLPAYAHQGDIPHIIPPPELLAPTLLHGIELTPGVPEQLHALIRIQAVRKDKPQFSVVDDNGRAKTLTPVFEIRFRNRSTLRRYINKQTGSIVTSESSPSPLTFFGNAGSGQKPLPTEPGIIKNGSRIVQLVSDIPI